MEAVYATAQEYYDALVENATNGMFPAISEDEMNCAYRATGEANCPNRCAVGMLIPDELYDSEIEGAWVDGIRVDKYIPKLPCGINYGDLEAIQSYHDNRMLSWSADEFIEAINQLLCFENVKQVDPQQFAKEV